MKTKTLIIIGIISFSITSLFIMYNQEIQLSTGMMQSDSYSSDTYLKELDTVICQDAISNWLDASEGLDPIPKDILVTEELFKQKNEFTLTLLNYCNVQSLSSEELQKLRDGWNEN